MDGSNRKLLLTIIIISVCLAISYGLSQQYDYKLAAIIPIIIALLTTVKSVYDFLGSYPNGESDSDDNIQRRKPTSRRPQMENSINSNTSQIEAGKNVQLGDRTEVNHYHYSEGSQSERNPDKENTDKTNQANDSPRTGFDIANTEANTYLLNEGSLVNVYFSPVKSEFGLTPITFRNFFSEYEMYSFSDQASGSITFEEFKSSLETIAPFTTGHDKASFAISQEEGQWYGLGLDNFVEALSKPKERYDRDYSGSTHNNEAAICLFYVKGGGTIAISCQPRTPSERRRSWFNPTSKLTIGFLTSGMPIDTQKFRDIAHQFNINLTSGVTKSKAYEAHIVANTKTMPVDYVSLYNSYSSGDDYANFAIVKNPLREHPKIKQDLEFSGVNGESLDKKYWDRYRNMASACEYVPVNITAGMYPNNEVNIDDIRVTVQTGLTIGHGHCNMDLSGIGLDGI